MHLTRKNSKATFPSMGAPVNKHVSQFPFQPRDGYLMLRKEHTSQN